MRWTRAACLRESVEARDRVAAQAVVRVVACLRAAVAAEWAAPVVVDPVAAKVVPRVVVAVDSKCPRNRKCG